MNVKIFIKNLNTYKLLCSWFWECKPGLPSPNDTLGSIVLAYAMKGWPERQG